MTIRRAATTLITNNKAWARTLHIMSVGCHAQGCACSDACKQPFSKRREKFHACMLANMLRLHVYDAPRVNVCKLI
jgi:hypothetical protein